VLVSAWVALASGLCHNAVVVAVGSSGVAVGTATIGVGVSAAATTLVAGSLPQAVSPANKLQAISHSRHDVNRFNGKISSMSNEPLF